MAFRGGIRGRDASARRTLGTARDWGEDRDLPEGGRGRAGVTYRLDPGVERVQGVFGGGHRRLGLVNFVRGGGVVRTGSLRRSDVFVVSRWCAKVAGRGSVGVVDGGG